MEIRFWKAVMLSDEIKVDLCGHMDYLTKEGRGPQSKKKKKTVFTAEYGSGSIMLWSCLSASSTGNLFWVHGCIQWVMMIFFGIMRRNLLLF